MALLHLTKVAVGCVDADDLRARLIARAAADAQGEASHVTRYRPTRHAELVGGSLFWILKHRLVMRSEILGFAETEEGKCRIRLVAEGVPVRGRPKRAHQGWRYLTAADAPADLTDGELDLALLPPELQRALADLALI